MEFKSTNCPNCNAQVNFEEDQDFVYCSHCGTQIYKDDPNKKSFTYRTIDDARIIEANNKIKELEFRERAQKRKFTIILIAIAIGLAAIIGIIFAVKGMYEQDSKRFTYMATMLIYGVVIIGMLWVIGKSDKK